MTIRNLINISGAELVLNDFNGLTMADGETVDGLMFGEQALRASLDIVSAIADNKLKVNDGSIDYEGQRAIDLIKDAIAQYTKDGKRIYTTSDRPMDHYRYFTTCGDDWAGQSRGTGPVLEFVVAPGETVPIDVRFIDDTYLKDGSMIYSDAEFGSWLRVDVIVPANMPYPAKNGDGNFDVINGALVPNTTGTGKYWVRDTETTVHRFINQMAMYGMGRQREDIQTAEPNFIPKGWIIRLSVFNAGSTETIRSAITLGMYRKITL